MAVTTSGKLFNREVAKNTINASIGKKLQFKPLMTFDNELKGVAGDTVTIPKYGMIGGAQDVAEGASVDFEAMSQTTDKYTVKQAGKGIEVTRHALQVGGKEVVKNQIIDQLVKAMDIKMEEDFIKALSKATLTFDNSADIISYAGVVNALDLFAEEDYVEKAIIVAPQQVTQLRLDPLFIDKSKYGNDVMMTGEIGMIAGARVISSRHIVENSGAYENYVVCLDNKDENGVEVMPAVTAFIASDLDFDEQTEAGTLNVKVTTMKDFLIAITNEAKVLKTNFKAKK